MCMPVWLRTLLAWCALACVPAAAYAQDDADRPALAHARPVPAWLDDAVIYEIFPREFSQAGNLPGVTARLDTLQRLGVNVLWIMPVHPIGKVKRLGTLGSPYAAQDFYAVDPALGSKADFAALVDAAHQRGMRVILDIAADHTSWDSVMMRTPSFYTRDAQGTVVAPHGWSDVAGLDYTNPALRKYMTDMFVYWLQTFHLDGFRCDAAAYVPTSFWEELRPTLERVKPDVLLLAEASKPELMTHAFDLDYAWPLMATLNKVIEHGEPATAVEQTWAAQTHAFGAGAEHMLISDDHDEQRAVVRYGAEGALAASALVFTLPGVPLLYNGMEVGDATPSGAPALFDKLTIYWGGGGGSTRTEQFYQQLIALRKSSAALRHGELRWVHNSAEEHVVSFERTAGGETLLLAVNLSNTPFRGTVEAQGEHWTEVTLPSVEGRGTAVDKADGGKAAPASLPALSLPAFGVRMFRISSPGGQ